MEVGLLSICQNAHPGMSDADMLRKEVEVAQLADEVGLDFMLLPEHHFDPNYSMMPDNMLWLAYLAGKTNKIKLGAGAIILPWHENPTRVAERIILMQIILGDRFMLSFGRGLAREEYKAFGIDMSTSRERFDEAAEIVLDILDRGVAEYDTKYFKQSRTEITPKPEFGYRDRGFCSVAMTPDSAMAAAHLGGTMMTFVQLPWEQHNEAIGAWRAKFEELHPGKNPGAPVVADFTYCHEDPKIAEEVARKHLSEYYLTVIKHYDFDGSHWANTNGYQVYQASANAIADAGIEKSCAAFADRQIWGTPDQIIEKWTKRFEMSGDMRAAMAMSYAGMPYDMVAESVRLIGEKVAPELRKLTAKQMVAAQ